MYTFATLTALRAFLRSRGFDGAGKLTVGYQGKRLTHPLWYFGHQCAEIEKRCKSYTVILFKKHV